MVRQGNFSASHIDPAGNIKGAIDVCSFDGPFKLSPYPMDCTSWFFFYSVVAIFCSGLTSCCLFYYSVACWSLHWNNPSLCKNDLPKYVNQYSGPYLLKKNLGGTVVSVTYVCSISDRDWIVNTILLRIYEHLETSLLTRLIVCNI